MATVGLLEGKTLTDLLVPEFKTISLPVEDLERLTDGYRDAMNRIINQLSEHVNKN